MTKTSELPHLFRCLKAPAAARATPNLAKRAREEEWSHGVFSAPCIGRASWPSST